MSALNAPYLNMLDQLDHAPLLAVRAARLVRLRQMVAQLWPQGHPAKLIHVAGTSGKGSVTRFLEAGFSVLGAVGAATSPHIFDYRERISINGQWATPEELTAAWDEAVWPLAVQAGAEGPHAVPGYGHLGLLLALVVMARHRVQWAALETGCGGRYDARMALPVEATVLTNVGDDHRKTLGAELWQRANEKAGIARKDVPFFTSVESGPAFDVVQQTCAHIGAPLVVVGQNKIRAIEAEIKSALGGTIPEGSLLQSAHQRANAALALSVITRLAPQIDRAEALRRMAMIPSAGRFQKLADDLYIDGAHNPDKIAALARDVAARFAGRKLVFMLGLSNGRDGAEVFAPLLPQAHSIVATQPRFKGVPAELLASSLRTAMPDIPITVEASAAHALLRARQQAADVGGIVVATGSMYMLDEALNPNPYVKHLNATYGWRWADGTNTDLHTHINRMIQGFG